MLNLLLRIGANYYLHPCPDPAPTLPGSICMNHYVLRAYHSVDRQKYQVPHVRISFGDRTPLTLYRIF